jgi:rfaE bifunctional protein nucleotidyltransferase chain/domain
MSFEHRIPEKIKDLNGLLAMVRRERMMGKSIVFTNGVFDILHRGHIDYLLKAADLGDVLILGLNSDASVKMLNKGDSRPIQDEASRAFVLASLSCIGAIHIFSEETPQDLIEKVDPDVLVKGGDYKIEEIAGSEHVLENGGKVTTIPLVDGFSTSMIEEKIKRS